MNARDLIKKHEGLRLKMYTDSLGHPTIGYGRALDTKGISVTEAEELLDNDLQGLLYDLAGIVSNFSGLSDNRKAALMDMAYNLGSHGLAGFTNMLSCIAAGDFDGAASEMLNSRWATQVGNRAKEDAALMKNG